MKTTRTLFVLLLFFGVTGFSSSKTISPGTRQVTFDSLPARNPNSLVMDFESVADFSLTFSPWTVADLDGKPTYGITNYTFPHSTEPMAFVAFNPAQVTPPMSGDTEIQPHGGSRFGACFSATTPPNNDWFISPRIQLNFNGSLELWVKSYTAAYGLEKYQVAVSTTDNSPASFSVISGSTPLEAPTDWSKVTFDLLGYNGQQVYVGIHCVTNDAFIFMIDDIIIDPGTTGSLIADFSANVTSIEPGQSVTFADSSLGNPITWSWTFPGGVPGSSTAQSPPAIRYDSPGIYDVTLTVGDGTSSNTKTKSGYIEVAQPYPSQMTLDFEGLPDFTTQFLPWTTADVNGGLTYTIGGTTFPGDGDAMAWICFNPTATTPPLSGVTAHSGVRTGACFSSQPPWNPNNKWLITPKMQLGTNGKIELWVRSFNSVYGLEKYNICVSQTGNQPSDFTVISGINPEEAPVNWTQRSYSLADFSGGPLYIGIQCVSDTVYFMMIDDISITSTVGTDEKTASEISVYPNPSSGNFFIRFGRNAPQSFTAELFDALGSKKITAFISDPGNTGAKFNAGNLPEGFYFLKLTYGTVSVTKKIIIVE